MLTFFKLIPGALSPIRGDKAALGHLPLESFRHCEPMRVSAAYGWYVFPPTSFELRFDGIQVRYRVEAGWEVLSEAYLHDFEATWAQIAPPEMRAYVPPFLRALRSPRGAVQVWSGLLVSSAPGWSVCVRGIPNMFQSNQYRHYEGIVETDVMQACPLFTNIQLMSTDEVIRISDEEPLFMAQPIQKSSYGTAAHAVQLKAPEAMAGSDVQPMSEQDWRNFRAAIRVDDVSETHRMGSYGAQSRRRANQNS